MKPADHHIYYTLALQMLMDALEGGLKIVREMSEQLVIRDWGGTVTISPMVR